MNRFANITLLFYILWVVIYNLIGQPKTWELGYFISESLFMCLAALFLAIGVNVKKWLAFEVFGYLAFRVLFTIFAFSFPKIGYEIDSNMWFMRSIGVILLLIIFINRKK